ncbi:hypothetical protein [Sporolactobacillus laevolacticus]|uniref:hypothetical protein n=1 Tax=Sporolactobacillus laevolacticus TaxID=33018 RepID=UPI0025B2A9F3|nr:hypothetical protein [Sporolactobacillus laevolacticus]MDN3956728.1 hypothetical protein [Sporolactobacillus laevolacticus]
MIRNMYVIQYIDHSTAWHLNETVQIDAKRRKYKKGDVILVKDKKYVVIEDFTRLRVKHFQREINPLKPLISQIPNI